MDFLHSLERDAKLIGWVFRCADRVHNVARAELAQLPAKLSKAKLKIFRIPLECVQAGDGFVRSKRDFRRCLPERLNLLGGKPKVAGLRAQVGHLPREGPHVRRDADDGRREAAYAKAERGQRRESYCPHFAAERAALCPDVLKSLC